MREAEADDDFYMGIAFMSAARSKTDRCVLTVDDMDRMQITCADSSDKPVHPSPHFLAFHGSSRGIRCAYLTYTPSAEAVGDMLAANVARVVYYATTELSPTVALGVSVSMEMHEYCGNLHWLRDRIFCLQSKDIF